MLFVADWAILAGLVMQRQSPTALPHAVGDEAKGPVVENPVGQGTQALCFFIPAEYVPTGQGAGKGIPLASTV